MAFYDAASPALPSQPNELRPVELACFALCVTYVSYLIACLLSGSWLIDVSGYVIPTDFINVWAAGRLVLEGRPEAAYDWSIHKSVEDAAIGYAFPGYYAWLYPPPFLVFAALLATLPLAVSQIVWPLLTFPAYVAAIRTIVGHRIGIIFAAAFPAVVPNFIVGQNGFLSAALLGGTLAFMERRPLVAGTFLGLLTYKPQFGLLFPLVLIVGRRWHVFCAAAAVAIIVNALSWAVFGTDAWIAFFHSLPAASQAVLTEGQADWSKLQSLFGVARWMGASESAAWVVQGAGSAAVVILTCALWRTHVSFDLKAAALATGALLVTPYLYMYDLVMLAVPMAFLIRSMMAAGALRGDIAALAAAFALLLVFPFVQWPLGPLAVLIVAGVVARRAVAELGMDTRRAVARG